MQKNYTALAIVAYVISAIHGISYGREFSCAGGDAACLASAIIEANANGEANTIFLEPGVYTSSPLAVTGVFPLTIIGQGAEATVITTPGPGASLFNVAPQANLTLRSLSIRRVGDGPIVNHGTIFLFDLKLQGNRRNIGGGGIANLGIAKIENTSITGNSSQDGAGGGISNTGAMTIANSTVTDNFTLGIRETAGGGILNVGTLVIVDSTIARNSGLPAVFGGGIENIGNLTILNSTIAANEASVGGGIFNRSGTTILRNTIVAGNVIPSTSSPSFFRGPDCSGEIISLGNNFIGDPSDCSITLQPSDLTGDPALGDFIDDGAPGHGRFPLLAGSAAIDAGNDSACSPEDQLGTPRLDRCDIGAVEFYPVINDLLAPGNVTTDFDPAPVPRAPAGTFRIIAEFTNTSSHPIRHRFAEVIELGGGNLLLNADGGPGGVGARLAPSRSRELQPGATETYEFIIGLQTQDQFTFVVNMLGDAEGEKTKHSVAMQ